MKVCFTIDGLRSGGAERVVVTLANAFFKSGNKVYIIIVSSKEEDSFYKIEDGICVSSIIKGRKKRVGVLKRTVLLRKKLVSLKPDIVISFLPHVIVYTFFALIGSKIPLITSERNDPNQYSFLYKVLSKMAFRNASGCVFQTQQAMEWYGKSVAKKSTIIINPVFLQFTPKGTIKRKKSVIFVGRLVEQKNLFFTIDVFSKFLSINPEYIFKIYGEGKLKNELFEYISKKNLSHNIFLMGNDSRWHEHEFDAGLFLLLSKYEGMPNALEEALALGIPSVASDCPIGGSSELVQYFGFGRLCKLNDECDTLNKMQLSLNDHNSKIGFEKADPMVIYNKWKDFIDFVISNKK